MNYLRRQLGNAAQPLKTRKGAIVVLAAVMLIVFLASVVFSVDVSYMQLTRTKLRSATDAAARAAGEGLSRAQDIDYARQRAKDIAAENMVAGKPLLLDDSDIIFGKSTQHASGAWAFTPNGQPINAVRVFGRRTREAPSGSVPTFFGKVFNVLDFQPVQAATVVRLDRDIILVVDRSTSMKYRLNESTSTQLPVNRACSPPEANTRWTALAGAVQRFVDALEETPQVEHLALVSYAGGDTGTGNYNHTNGCTYSTPTVSTDCPLAENHAEVIAAVDDLSNTTWGGYTNIAAGIKRGVQVLTSPSARPFAAKTIVLMSDGEANRAEGASCSGVAPCAAAGNVAKNEAANAANHDIIIHTVRYGEANAALMQDIAQATGGNYYNAPNAAALQDIFEEIALTLPVVFTD